jgi:hypothetical protein
MWELGYAMREYHTSGIVHLVEDNASTLLSSQPLCSLIIVQSRHVLCAIEEKVLLFTSDLLNADRAWQDCRWSHADSLDF